GDEAYGGERPPRGSGLEPGGGLRRLRRAARGDPRVERANGARLVGLGRGLGLEGSEGEGGRSADHRGVGAEDGDAPSLADLAGDGEARGLAGANENGPGPPHLALAETNVERSRGGAGDDEAPLGR